MCRLCESGSLLRACADAERAKDGRLIYMASGVLAAVSLINVQAEASGTSMREREMLEALSDELKYLAYEMRRHHDAIKEQ